MGILNSFASRIRGTRAPNCTDATVFRYLSVVLSIATEVTGVRVEKVKGVMICF